MESALEALRKEKEERELVRADRQLSNSHLNIRALFVLGVWVAVENCSAPSDKEYRKNRPLVF